MLILLQKINIYYLNIFLMFFWWLVLQSSHDKKKAKKIFSFVVGFQWFLISSLRHITVGGRDVFISYKKSFYESLNYSWAQSLTYLLEFFYKDIGRNEPGYLILEKIVSLFTSNYQLFLSSIAFVFIVPFSIFIYKHSRMPLISWLIYSTLFYTFFSLTGFRQTIATSLIVLCGYKYIQKRNFFKFFLISVLALTFHKSAIMFFPFYFIGGKQISRRRIVIYILLFIIVYLNAQSIYFPIAKILGFDNAELLFQNQGGTTNYVILLTIILVGLFWKLNIITDNNREAMYFINAFMIGYFLSILSFQNQSFMRLQQYYSLFLTLLIPEILLAFEKKERIVVVYIFLTVLISLFLKTQPYYRFFWE